jgi:hypothetical protein
MAWRPWSPSTSRGERCCARPSARTRPGRSASRRCWRRVVSCGSSSQPRRVMRATARRPSIRMPCWAPTAAWACHRAPATRRTAPTWTRRVRPGATDCWLREVIERHGSSSCGESQRGPAGGIFGQRHLGARPLGARRLMPDQSGMTAVTRPVCRLSRSRYSAVSLPVHRANSYTDADPRSQAAGKSGSHERERRTSCRLLRATARWNGRTTPHGPFR